MAKKDGKRRMVQDYHHINQWTIKNRYPLPLIADILDGVGKRKVFTKLDLRWSYNNVRATGHKTPGESSVNITVSVYDTTHLQENPQRIG